MNNKIKFYVWWAIITFIMITLMIGFVSADEYYQHGQEIHNEIDVEGSAHISIWSYFSDWNNAMAIDKINKGLSGWTAESVMKGMFKMMVGANEEWLFGEATNSRVSQRPNNDGYALAVIHRTLTYLELQPFFEDYRKTKEELKILKQDVLINEEVYLNCDREDVECRCNIKYKNYVKFKRSIIPIYDECKMFF